MHLTGKYSSNKRKFYSRQFIPILIVIVALLVGILSVYLWRVIINKKIAQEQSEQNNQKTYVDNNITMGIISDIDQENKKITIADELGKGQQDIYITDQTAILSTSEKGEEPLQSDFDSLEKNLLVRTITNQVYKDQQRIEAWDLYIIRKVEK